MNRLLAPALMAWVLAGCAAHRTQLYSWGDYENVIYRSYASPGKYPPAMQVETLEKDYQTARAANARMPPGWHAQLGYLYFQLGRTDQARQEFSTEKAEFPESALLMDRLLSHLAPP